MFGIIGTIVFGLVVGVLAKFLFPGRDPGGIIVTILIGIAGSFVGSWIGRMLGFGSRYEAKWIMSIVGAMLLLFLYRMTFGRSSSNED